MKGMFEKKAHLYVSGRHVQGFKGWPPMFHTHAELLYVIKGNIHTTVDGKLHTLQQGELLVLFPYLPHSYGDAPDAEAIVFLIDPMALAFDNTMLTKKPVRHYTDGRSYYDMLDRAVELLNRGKVKTALGYLNAVIGEFLEVIPLEDAGSTNSDMTVKILEYCTEHFSEEITIQSVADALYVSPSYVSKIFSNKLKYSFREYVNYLRITNAKSLLRNSEKRIVDIMFECGFKNQSSFNRVFRSICGVSPKEYKNNINEI